MTLLSRRSALLGAAAVFATLRLRPSLAQAPGPFTLPPLPYGYDANEPHIDAQTMTLHHTRHHAAYVANLNVILKDHGQIAAQPLATTLAKLAEMPEALRTPLRNNGGGHANHVMFWTLMGGKGGTPTGPLAEAITRDLGGFEPLQANFNRAGLGQFGSGWVFVTADKAGKLALSTRPNQDSPLMDGAMPIFGNDVWEHAYYLKYNNRRADYLAAWWNVLDWPKIAARYEAAKAGSLAL
jgi:Fe-Mn family superoxide dismutase